MKFRHALTLSWVTVLASTSMAIAVEAPAYLKLTKAEAEWESNDKMKDLKIEVEAQQPIPMDGKSGAFGYAALTSDTDNVLVLVTHLPIDDSSHEQPESGFHVHVLDLKKPTEACKDATLEVDLDGSSKNRAFDADYAWQIKGNEIEIEDVPTADLGDAGVENIVSFTLKPVLDQQQKPTHLCITVTDQI